MASLDLIFAALADPTRRAVLERLSDGDATIGELSRPFPISPPAVSHHLKILGVAGLVERTRAGQHIRLRLQPEAFAQVLAWLAARG
ncbi:ArsR/SmtB family transcription factor [Sphingomonas bacterium]|uniref:ArsR/SmtB family transcription factor n=1 Tax=Sphingomonas bacterium TaxID=1895847 RepID=UPI0015754CD0|nr:metalloregulator ArsR/SmtB family transcription factor [Sphingomonas bacterium]